MPTLYVISTGPNSGKTAVSVALGLHYKRQGREVTWFKPLSTTVVAQEGQLVDQDAEFVRDALGLSPSVSELAPVALTPEMMLETLASGEPPEWAENVRRQAASVGQGADLLLVEGGTTPVEGMLFGLDARRMAAMLDARVLVVTRWASALALDEVVWAGEMFGERVAGVVLNVVPQSRVSFAEGTAREALGSRGVPILAVVPREKILSAMSVGELAEVLNAEVLTARDHLDDLVENLSVGAMSVDRALSYFRRTPNKAVITGGDRPDIQLAALETSTRCLILTGNLQPSPIILGRAEEVGVPILTVRHDTLTTVEIAEQYFGKIRFHQPQKLQRFVELFNQHMDYDRLTQALWAGSAPS